MRFCIKNLDLHMMSTNFNSIGKLLLFFSHLFYFIFILNYKYLHFGDKPTDCVQLYSGFHRSLVCSQFVHQPQLDLRSLLSYCPWIVPKSCQSCLRRDPNSPFYIVFSCLKYFMILWRSVSGNCRLLDEEGKKRVFFVCMK